VFLEVGFAVEGSGFEVFVSRVDLYPFPLLLQLQVMVPGLSFPLLAQVAFTLPASVILFFAGLILLLLFMISFFVKAQLPFFK
jgi:hypothetical protein